MQCYAMWILTAVLLDEWLKRYFDALQYADEDDLNFEERTVSLHWQLLVIWAGINNSVATDVMLCWKCFLLKMIFSA